MGVVIFGWGDILGYVILGYGGVIFSVCKNRWDEIFKIERDIFGYGSGWVEIFWIDWGGDFIGEILIFGVSKRKLWWDEILVS